jgi:hypothetical protein
VAQAFILELDKAIIHQADLFQENKKVDIANFADGAREGILTRLRAIMVKEPSNEGNTSSFNRGSKVAVMELSPDL